MQHQWKLKHEHASRLVDQKHTTHDFPIFLDQALTHRDTWELAYSFRSLWEETGKVNTSKTS